MNDLNKKTDFDQQNDKKVDKRRRVVTRAGAITPLMMTLISKTALGQVSHNCTPSGQASGNTSAHSDSSTPCDAAGFAASEWQANADNSTADNGCAEHWINPGVIPFDARIDSATTEKQIYKPNISMWGTNEAVADLILTNSDGKATLFADIFGSGSGTVWENLSSGTPVAIDAITAYLNAALNLPEFDLVYENISPEDIVNFYKLANGGPGFTTTSGTVIDSTFNAAFYLSSITR